MLQHFVTLHRSQEVLKEDKLAIVRLGSLIIITMQSSIYICNTFTHVIHHTFIHLSIIYSWQYVY